MAAINTLLLETVGSLFVSLIIILFIMCMCGKLSILCKGRKSSPTITTSSNTHVEAQAELSPPPSYDELLSCGIFVIDVDETKIDYSVNLDDDQLPTYDQVLQFQR